MIDLRTMLSMPLLFRGFAGLLRKSDLMQRVTRDVLQVAPGMRVLDVGCGPAAIRATMPEVDYWGLDISTSYIAAARRRYRRKGTFMVRAVDCNISFVDLGSFDLIYAVALVHHLDSEAARALFRAARAALRPGGRCVTLDNVYVSEQSAVARWIINRDRGRHVRDPEGYLALAKPYFGTVDVAIVHDMLRIPYTHIVMDCRP